MQVLLVPFTSLFKESNLSSSLSKGSNLRDVNIEAVEVNCLDARMPRRSALGSHTRAMTYISEYLQVPSLTSARRTQTNK